MEIIKNEYGTKAVIDGYSFTGREKLVDGESLFILKYVDEDLYAWVEGNTIRSQDLDLLEIVLDNFGLNGVFEPQLLKIPPSSTEWFIEIPEVTTQ